MGVSKWSYYTTHNLSWGIPHIYMCTEGYNIHVYNNLGVFCLNFFNLNRISNSHIVPSCSHSKEGYSTSIMVSLVNDSFFMI